MSGARSVLHVLATDERRGAETFGTVLSERLAARGWRSDIRAVRSTRRPDNHGVTALGSSWRDPRGLTAFRRLARDYDVVVAHGSSTLWTGAIGSLLGCPPFVYVNIGDPLFWSSTAARRLRVGMLLSRAAAVAAISPRASTSLTEHLRVAPARITVIPNGRSSLRFTPADAERKRAARDRIGLPEAASVIAFVGSLSAEKQPELALRAAAGLANAHLVVAGDGPLRGVLEQAGRELMPGRVHWLGSVTRPEDLLAASDVAVLTSRSEGVPGVLVEAGLTGLPCVTTDVGYTSDVVLDGQTGRVVRSTNPAVVTAALQEALTHADVWGPAARRHCAATFGLDAVVEQWDSLLDAVVSRPGGGAHPA